MTTKKTAKKQTARQNGSSGVKRTAQGPKSMPKEGRDPAGGLTAKGRAFFNEKEGSHLRPGVQGPADTPEKKVRKGSFLRRHFAHPRGPMEDEKGAPTRLALSAHAWGEPVPKTASDAKRLAAKGHELLEEYHTIKKGQKAAAKKSPGKSTSAKKEAVKTKAQKGVTVKAAGKRTTAKGSATKAAASGTRASR